MPANVVILLFCAVALLAGCRKGASAPPPALSAGEIQPTVTHALTTASPEARQQANAYVADLQSRNWGAAVDDMHQLMSRPDLNYAQKTALARAMRATMTEMQDAADKGDQSAADVLRVGRASK